MNEDRKDKGGKAFAFEKRNKKGIQRRHDKRNGHFNDEKWTHGEKGEVLLEVKDLKVQYTSDKRVVYAVNGVSFDIKRGESLGLVGESGCGKSTIAKAILRILPDMSSRISDVQIIYKGEDITTFSEKEMEKIRGNEISMIFQDPMTALNPVRKIITQISSVIKLHNPHMSSKMAKKRGVRMLELVGISPERVTEYPHQFSGGMQQRVEVAIGLACHHDLLLADEPTTALDVTMQAQVLGMMTGLMREKNTALLLITHNLGIVAETCDSVAVLYGGEIVEYGTKEELFRNPSHPYTIGLFKALPSSLNHRKKLVPIKGIMPEPSELPEGCKFHTRCPYCTEECRSGPVPVVELGGAHRCQCHNIEAVKEANKNEYIDRG